MTDEQDKTMAAMELSLRIRPLLAGHDPSVQGAVLADLLSIWLAGHRPELRDNAFIFHVLTVRDLIEESEKEIFGDAGWHEPDQ